MKNKTTNLYFITWGENSTYSAWMKGANVIKALQRAEKELLYFKPNQLGFSFTIKLCFAAITTQQHEEVN